VVARAERLALLIQVLDHHDRREAGGMLAVLGAHAPAEQRAQWLAAFALAESPLPPSPELRPAPPLEAGSDGDPADRLALAAAHDGDLTAPFGALPSLPGRNGARVGQGLADAVGGAAQATDLRLRRDALLDVLDALRRWRAVRDHPAGARNR
jgi:hypothetical protein